MVKEEFLVLVKTMRAVHPAMFSSRDTVDVWFSLLKDLEYNDAAAALGKHLSTSPFPPTIADIRLNVQADDGLNAEQAWALAYKAISNSSYNSEEEFANLPPLVKKAIGSPANLRELALMPNDTVCSVEKSHFIRTYDMEKKRKRELDSMPKEIRERLEQVSAKMLEGSDG